MSDISGLHHILPSYTIPYYNTTSNTYVINGSHGTTGGEEAAKPFTKPALLQKKNSMLFYRSSLTHGTQAQY